MRTRTGIPTRVFLLERRQPGVCLVAIGAVSITAAAVQHGRFIATLPEQYRPTHYAMTWSVWLGAVAAALAFSLAYTTGEA